MFFCPKCQTAQPKPVAVDKMLRALVAELLDGARDPARIGQRVLLIDHALRSKVEIIKPKQRDLANELGISEQAIHKQLSRSNNLLERLKKKFSSSQNVDGAVNTTDQG